MFAFPHTTASMIPGLCHSFFVRSLVPMIRQVRAWGHVVVCALVWTCVVSSAQAQPVAKTQPAEKAATPSQRLSTGIKQTSAQVHAARTRAMYVLDQGERLLPPVTVASRRVTRAYLGAASEGRRVIAIGFSCDLPSCSNPLTINRFKDIAGLFVGMRYSATSMELARQRLLKTGFFNSNLQISTQTVNAQSVRLNVDASGATLIRRITFLGVNPPPFREDLRKAMIYREGRPYLNDMEKQRVQIQSLRDLFNKEGYFSTNISMSTQRDKSNPRIIDLTFTFKKGKELRMCSLGIRGLTVFTYDEARDYLLSDIALLERRFNLLLPRYTSKALRIGQNNLIEEYRQRGYFQARFVNKQVTKRIKDECVDVLFDVIEGPRWKLAFDGNTQFKRAELIALMPFYNTGYVDAQAIAQAERALTRLYMTRGYAFSQVKGVETKRNRFDRTLTFEIKENQKVEVRQVLFHRENTQVLPRPEALSDDALQGIMGTKPFGLFASGGYLQYDELLSDFVRIEAAYKGLGFLQAKVDNFAIELIEDARALRIHLSVSEGPRTVISGVEIQGNRRLPTGTIRQLLNVRPTPDPKKPEQTNAFVPLKIKADTSRLTQRYASMGYPMASVGTRCVLPDGSETACELPQLADSCVVRTSDQLKDAPSVITLKGGALPVHLASTPQEAVCRWSIKPRPTRSCQRIRASCSHKGGITAKQVRIVHRIAEGPFVRVGDILLRGNFRTKSELIRRELDLRKGDMLNVQKLLAGQASLRSLGLFDSVSVEAVGLDEGALASKEATVAIVISVEESQHQYVDTRIGVQGRDLLSSDLRRVIVLGELEYNNRNLWGLGKRFTPRLLLAADTLQVLGLGINSERSTFGERFKSLDYLVGAELIYRDPRFLKSSFGVDRLFLTVSPYYLLDLIGVSTNRLQREEAGVRAEARKELKEITDRLFVTLGLEAKWIATRAPDTGASLPNGKPLFSPRRTIAKTFLEIVFDRRDSTLNPTEGYYLEVSPEWVSGNASEGVQTTALQDSYFKASFNGSAYTSFWNKGVVIGQSFRYGHVIPVLDRTRPVPDDERYLLGGVGSVRGFPEGGISTSSTGGIGQLRGGEFMMGTNTEVRYPLLKDVGLWAASFFDVGLLVDCYDDQNTDVRIGCYQDALSADAVGGKLRYTTGVGVRYLIVEQIPLLLDYAVLLNRRPGEAFGSLHFNVGYTF